MINTNLYTKPHHPDAESTRNLGIGALVCLGLTFFCGCPTGIIGVILGFIAVSKAKTVIAEFHASPGSYHIESLTKAETARTLGLIGAYGGIITTILWIFLFAFIVISNYLENNL
jgi:hypothetical protein